MQTQTKKRNLVKFGPKKSYHTTVGEKCVACKIPFEAGDMTTLIELGPGCNPFEQEKARKGKLYNAVTVEIHWTCATGEKETIQSILSLKKIRADNFNSGGNKC